VEGATDVETARRLRLPAILVVLIVATWTVRAAETEKKSSWDIGGRIAPQLVVTSYPENSLFRDVVGSTSADAALDARVWFVFDRGRWTFNVDYQFIALYGDRVEYTRDFPPELQILFQRLPTDETRLFDLTYVFTDSGKFAALNRLDRLSVRHTTEKTVVAFGRQAISWGNGLIYTPMDIFNPFDPAAVDKEFKTGDDMLYGQYLRGNGHDAQGVMVFRRNPVTGDVETDVGSLAFKYHGFAGQGEYDVLAAQHFGDTLVGAGGNHSIGGSVWRGDLVVDFDDDSDETTPTFVTSVSHSFIWGGKNLSGVVEYYYNGFGQSDGCYSPECLADNPELLKRIARGELFTLGRNYVAVSATIEVTPLFQLTPNLFTNLGDPSALLQVATQNDLREDMLLFGAVNVPIGADGTEFGGIPTGVGGVYFSNDFSVFVQLRWYW
jgi:hypothetical protein